MSNIKNIIIKGIVGSLFLGSTILAKECEQIQQFLVSKNYTINSVTDCVEDGNGNVTSLNINNFNLLEEDVNHLLTDYMNINKINYKIYNNTINPNTRFIDLPKAFANMDKLTDLSIYSLNEDDVITEPSFSNGIIKEGGIHLPKTLENLDLGFLHLTRDDIKTISKVGNIKKLRFFGCQFDENLDFGRLKNLDNLRELSYEFESSQVINYSSIPEICNLKTVNLSGVIINQKILDRIKRLRGLKYLMINNGFFDGKVNKYSLKDCKKLKELHIEYNLGSFETDRRIKLSLPISSFKKLYINGIQLTRDNIYEISKSYRLKEITLKNSFKDDELDLKRFRELSSLKELTIENNYKSIIKNIRYLTYLKKLTLRNCIANLDTLYEISKLYHLKELHLDNFGFPNANEITVTLDGNEGTSSSINVINGATYGNITDSSRPGYNFLGWYTDKSGGSKVTGDTKVINASNHTLYAQWKPITYEVLFEDEGEVYYDLNETYTYDKSYELPGQPTKKTGFKFIGWKIDGDDDKIYNKGDLVKNLTTESNGTVTVKAIWRREISVLVMNFDLTFENHGNIKQHEIMSPWNDPKELAEEFKADMLEVNHGYAEYNIVKWIDMDEMPKNDQGHSFTKDYYYDTLMKASKEYDGAYWKSPELEDLDRQFAFAYDDYYTKYGVYKMVDNNEIDEVWIFVGPCTGVSLFESVMIGRDAYFVNGYEIEKDVRPFVTLAFSYERTIAEMLHVAGHRMESTMGHIFGYENYNKPYSEYTDWEKFSAYDLVSPGNAGCGQIHFPPNGVEDYDWNNGNIVKSTCLDWSNYPNNTDKKTDVNRETWGNGDQREFIKWWFNHIPHANSINTKTKKYNN